MLNLKILIIKGHGGGDVGAVSDSFTEYIINDYVATSFYNHLKERNINVILETDNKPLEGEVALVNKSDFDIVISCHTNAGNGDGFECFYYSTDTFGYNLCCDIEEEVKAIGQNSRGVKTGNQYRIINSVIPTSIILEGFFLDNVTDRTDFKTIDSWKKLGIAYAKGVLKYLGYVEPLPPTSNEITFYRVVCGSYRNRDNAEARVKELEEFGFNAFIDVYKG